jgi:CRISPR-associated protein Cmr5
VQQTREQRYAAAVLTRVEGSTQALGDGKTKYGAMAHQLPVLIRTAGLAQALAFVEARNEDALNRLLDDLAAVMGLSSGTTLVRTSREADLVEYMRLTQHALAALLWFKRYAQSVLEVKPGQEVKR